jgi:hypothetical protein
MEKRLTRTEMLFSLGFIFMLILAMGAFFVGLKIGSDKTEAKYVPSKKLNTEAAAKVTAYEQQDLVSFYHTVFLPYREFMNEWVAEVDNMKAGLTSDPASKLKELSSLADKQYDAASKAVVSNVSPLLVDAQTNILKSLKLFSQAMGRHRGTAEAGESIAVIAGIGKDVYYREAIEFSLQAQAEYYSSMLKWNASIDPDLPEDFIAPKLMELADWKTQPLIIKNKLVAEELHSRMLLTAYYPQDLTARIDQFISSGQASNMKIKTVSSIVDLLISTDAVRTDDFLTFKSRYYEDAVLPQLPFFIS